MPCISECGLYRNTGGEDEIYFDTIVMERVGEKYISFFVRSSHHEGGNGDKGNYIWDI